MEVDTSRGAGLENDDEHAPGATYTLAGRSLALLVEKRPAPPPT
jgi:hypothetical protein